MSRLDRVRGRPHGGPYPFRVDLHPPAGGWSYAVEEAIIRFLEHRSGAFDVWGEIATGGDFRRYCFAHHNDAEAFQRQFMAVADKAVLREVFPRPEKL